MLIGVALEHGWNSQGKVSRMHILKVVKSDVLTKSEKSISQVFFGKQARMFACRQLF